MRISRTSSIASDLSEAGDATPGLPPLTLLLSDDNTFCLENISTVSQICIILYDALNEQITNASEEFSLNVCPFMPLLQKSVSNKSFSPNIIFYMWLIKYLSVFDGLVIFRRIFGRLYAVREEGVSWRPMQFVDRNGWTWHRRCPTEMIQNRRIWATVKCFIIAGIQYSKLLFCKLVNLG